jgi:hypothetical protein
VTSSMNRTTAVFAVLAGASLVVGAQEIEKNLRPAQVSSAPRPASPLALAEGLDLIAPVHNAFTKVAAAQAELPPAADDRERLERLEDLDQAGREVFIRLDFSTLPHVQQLAARSAAWSEINQHDLDNQAALERMIPKDGWFNKSKYGAKASKAAFHIVQHATNNPDLMRLALGRMEPLIASGEVDGSSYALLYDRVSLIFDHKSQRYGSQVSCQAGVWVPQSLEDPVHVDERRGAVGLTQTEADYLKLFANQPCE